MLSKKYRLPVQTVIGQRGLSVRGRYFSMKVLPAQKDHARLGVVVSKQVAKKASARVALRRLIYSALGQEVKSLKAAKDFLVIATPSAGNSPKDDMIKELHQLLNQLTN